MSDQPAASAADAIKQLLLQGRFKQAEQAAIERLREDPLNGQCWVYLGESLLRQDCGSAARRVFERAWLLDPQAAWVPAVQQALSDTPSGPVRATIDALLAVPRTTVAAAVMTANDAGTIERCMKSLLNAVDEIVVIDSSSTDGTLELLASMPSVKVIRDIPLNDDFAGKRNAGLAQIESDWVLWVDADEWLFPEDVPLVREAAALFNGSDMPPVLNICQVNRIQGRESRDYSMPRMFPTRRGLRYHGRVHEQVIEHGKRIYEDGALRQSVRIRVHHDGYEPDVMKRKDKLNRNIRLLERMAAEEPDNPGWLLYLGRESLGAGQTDKALELLLEAERLAVATPNFGRLPDILMHQYRIYMHRRDYDLAEAACNRALACAPSFPDAEYGLAQVQLRKAVALLQKAEHRLNQAKTSFTTYRGVVTADRTILDWKADLALADLALLTGKKTEAISRYAAILQRHPELEAVRNKLHKLQSD